MRYGACTWIFGDEPLEEIATRLSALGCDGLELMGDLRLYRAREVKAILSDHGLDALSITPESVDLAHPDRSVRDEAVDYYLRLLDFAAELGSPVVGCHGAVGRIRAIGTYEEERAAYVESVRRIARRGKELGLRLAMEALNRYESHLLNTAEEAMRFVKEVGSPNVGILLDTYHMNIEEGDLRGAILEARERLFLFHVADSNRRGIGRGHIDFIGLYRALAQIGYDGPIVLECTASGPDPFTPVKGPGWREEVWRDVEESVELLRLYEWVIGGRHAARI